jgi:hypothetical protein
MINFFELDNICKLKLVEEPLKGDEYLLDGAVMTVFVTSFKRLCRVGEGHEGFHILILLIVA